MSNEVTIERIKLEDLPVILKVAAMSFSEEARRPEVIAPGLLRALMQEPKYQLKAVIYDEVAGFLIGAKNKGQNEAIIEWIAVNPKYQKRGIGRTLLNEFEKTAKEDNVARISLITPFARGFYEKCGYTLVGVHYKLIKSVTANIIHESSANIKLISWENTKELIDAIGETEAWNFLAIFFDSYKQQKNLFSAAVVRNNKIVGLIVAKENEWSREIFESSYLFYIDFDVLQELLNALIAECIRRGALIAGITIGKESDATALIKNGWSEAHLPIFWTSYKFFKNI